MRSRVWSAPTLLTGVVEFGRDVGLRCHGPCRCAGVRRRRGAVHCAAARKLAGQPQSAAHPKQHDVGGCGAAARTPRVGAADCRRRVGPIGREIVRCGDRGMPVPAVTPSVWWVRRRAAWRLVRRRPPERRGVNVHACRSDAAAVGKRVDVVGGESHCGSRLDTPSGGDTVDDVVFLEDAAHEGERTGGAGVVVGLWSGAHRPVDQPRVVLLCRRPQLVSTLAGRGSGGGFQRHRHRSEPFGDAGDERDAAVVDGGVDRWDARLYARVTVAHYGRRGGMVGRCSCDGYRGVERGRRGAAAGAARPAGPVARGWGRREGAEARSQRPQGLGG
jgi:hypothetical protein